MTDDGGRTTAENQMTDGGRQTTEGQTTDDGQQTTDGGRQMTAKTERTEGGLFVEEAGAPFFRFLHHLAQHFPYVFALFE